MEISKMLEKKIRELARKEIKDYEEKGCFEDIQIDISKMDRQHKDFRFAYEWFVDSRFETYLNVSKKYADQKMEKEKKRTTALIAGSTVVSIIMSVVIFHLHCKFVRQFR